MDFFRSTKSLKMQEAGEVLDLMCTPIHSGL
jgi:hypothetical protein